MDSAQLSGQTERGLGSAKRPQGEGEVELNGRTVSHTATPYGPNVSLSYGAVVAPRTSNVRERVRDARFRAPLVRSSVARDVLLKRLARSVRDVRRDDPRRVLRFGRSRVILAKVRAQYLGIDADFGGEFLRRVRFLGRRHSFVPFVCSIVHSIGRHIVYARTFVVCHELDITFIVIRLSSNVCRVQSLSRSTNSVVRFQFAQHPATHPRWIRERKNFFWSAARGPLDFPPHCNPVRGTYAYR